MLTINNNCKEYDSEEFEKNLREQQAFIDAYEHEHENEIPFNDWGGFLWHYWHFRACVASLRNNPDTKDDEDFLALCEYWKNISTSPSRLSEWDFGELKRRYDLLLDKPAFYNNPLIKNNELLGSFVKSIHELFTQDYYWEPFFDLD